MLLEALEFLRHKKIIIGLGTGRCGTRSLTKLLNENGIPATHEKWRLVWKPDKERCLRVLKKMVDAGESDVGFYWLNYVDIVLSKYPSTKFVCFKREKEKVLESFSRTSIESDPILCSLIWTRFNVEGECYKLCDHVTPEEIEQMDYSTREWVETYWNEPFYNDTMKCVNHFEGYDLTNKKSYMNKYYDDYYIKSEKLEKEYPNNFRIMDMLNTLNTEEGKHKLFNFIGIVPNTAIQ